MQRGPFLVGHRAPRLSGNTAFHTGGVLCVSAVCPQARGWEHGAALEELGGGSWAVAEGLECTRFPHTRDFGCPDACLSCPASCPHTVCWLSMGGRWVSPRQAPRSSHFPSRYAPLLGTEQEPSLKWTWGWSPQTAPLPGMF